MVHCMQMNVWLLCFSKICLSLPIAVVLSSVTSHFIAHEKHKNEIIWFCVCEVFDDIHLQF